MVLDVVSEGNVGAPGLDFTGGWTFNVNSQITVDGVGFWDQGSNGLLANHDVGLWTSAGGLLASATVTNASTPVASALNTGRWLFTAISPVTLSPGTYVVGATLLAGGDENHFSDAIVTTGTVLIPEVSFGEGRLRHGGGAVLQFPSQLNANGGFYGGTLRTAVAVPEPSAFFYGGVLFLLAGYRYWSCRVKFVCHCDQSKTASKRVR